MFNALASHRGLDKNLQSKGDFRNIQINMPEPVNVDIEFKDICLEVSTGLLKKSK